jgi:hypothetical protein
LTSVVPKSSTTTTAEPGARKATFQEFKNGVDVERVKQHPTTETKGDLRPVD